jgi:hypothetical protein
MAPQLVEASELPVPDIGAPAPVVVAREDEVIVSYVSRAGRYEGVRFRGLYALQFGPPNDEAISGHPLASSGLNAYGRYVVRGSPWLDALEQMNSAHPQHRPGFLSQHRHFIIAFHDTLFECVAQSFEIVPASTAVSLISSAVGAT